MIFNCSDYREILKNEFEKRQSHNSAYSMRAFANFLEIAPSRLSEVFKRKQGLSSQKAKKIAQKLNLNNMETDFFCTLVESEHSRSKIGKEAAKEKLKKFLVRTDTKKSMEIFDVISSWEHLAILELLNLKSKTKSIKWLAKKIGLSELLVKQAVKRLDTVGLVIKKNNVLKRVNQEFFVWGAEIPSASIKNYHKSVLDKAIESLFTSPINEREFNSVVMPIDSSKLPEAKKLIKKFNREMNELLSHEKRNDRVYYLSTQLFPIDKD